MPETPSKMELSSNLTVEDHGSEFYLISRGGGHDITITLEGPVAERLARFILDRGESRGSYVRRIK